MTVAAGDIAAGAAGAAIGGSAAPREPGGSSTAFAIAVFLLGFAMIGFWLAFHKPENAETGGFPGLLGQMAQWVHLGEEKPGAEGPPGQPGPGILPATPNLLQLGKDLGGLLGKGGNLLGKGLYNEIQRTLHLIGL
jgi:hypothetical protein